MAKAIRQESVSTKSEHYRERMQCGTHSHRISPRGERIGGIKVKSRELVQGENTANPFIL